MVTSGEAGTAAYHRFAERMLAFSISMAEHRIRSLADQVAMYRDGGMPDREAKAREKLRAWTLEHAGLCESYERRFGDIPRLPMGSVDTRGPDHPTVTDPALAGLWQRHGWPPLPAIRVRALPAS